MKHMDCECSSRNFNNHGTNRPISRGSKLRQEVMDMDALISSQSKIISETSCKQTTDEYSTMTIENVGTNVVPKVFIQTNSYEEDLPPHNDSHKCASFIQKIVSNAKTMLGTRCTAVHPSSCSEEPTRETDNCRYDSKATISSNSKLGEIRNFPSDYCLCDGETNDSTSKLDSTTTAETLSKEKDENSTTSKKTSVDYSMLCQLSKTEKSRVTMDMISLLTSTSTDPTIIPNNVQELELHDIPNNSVGISVFDGHRGSYKANGVHNNNPSGSFDGSNYTNHSTYYDCHNEDYDCQLEGRNVLYVRQSNQSDDSMVDGVYKTICIDKGTVTPARVDVGLEKSNSNRKMFSLLDTTWLNPFRKDTQKKANSSHQTTAVENKTDSNLNIPCRDVTCYRFEGSGRSSSAEPSRTKIDTQRCTNGSFPNSKHISRETVKPEIVVNIGDNLKVKARSCDPLCLVCAKLKNQSLNKQFMSTGCNPINKTVDKTSCINCDPNCPVCSTKSTPTNGDKRSASNNVENKNPETVSQVNTCCNNRNQATVHTTCIDTQSGNKTQETVRPPVSEAYYRNKIQQLVGPSDSKTYCRHRSQEQPRQPVVHTCRQRSQDSVRSPVVNATYSKHRSTDPMRSSYVDAAANSNKSGTIYIDTPVDVPNETGAPKFIEEYQKSNDTSEETNGLNLSKNSSQQETPCNSLSCPLSITSIKNSKESCNVSCPSMNFISKTNNHGYGKNDTSKIEKRKYASRNDYSPSPKRVKSCHQKDEDNQCAFIGSPVLNPANFKGYSSEQPSYSSSPHDPPYYFYSPKAYLTDSNLRDKERQRTFDRDKLKDELDKIREIERFRGRNGDRFVISNRSLYDPETRYCNEQHIRHSDRRFDRCHGEISHISCPVGIGHGIDDEIDRITKELKMENKVLKSDLLEMKFELKHALEKVEGPMKSKLEAEKSRCEHLQHELHKASNDIKISQETFAKESEELKLQLSVACSNMSNLEAINKRLKEEMSVLDGMCAKLEDDLVTQKLNEAEILKRLTRRATGAEIQSTETINESNLNVIARKLSKTIKESEPCEDCSILPVELTDAAKIIKDLTDMVEKKRKADIISLDTFSISKTNCSCQSPPVMENTGCQYTAVTDRGVGVTKSLLPLPPCPYSEDGNKATKTLFPIRHNFITENESSRNIMTDIKSLNSPCPPCPTDQPSMKSQYTEPKTADKKINYDPPRFTLVEPIMVDKEINYKNTDSCKGDYVIDAKVLACYMVKTPFCPVSKQLCTQDKAMPPTMKDQSTYYCNDQHFEDFKHPPCEQFGFPCIKNVESTYISCEDIQEQVTKNDVNETNLYQNDTHPKDINKPTIISTEKNSTLNELLAPCKTLGIPCANSKAVKFTCDDVQSPPCESSGKPCGRNEDCYISDETTGGSAQEISDVSPDVSGNATGKTTLDDSTTGDTSEDRLKSPCFNVGQPCLNKDKASPCKNIGTPCKTKEAKETVNTSEAETATHQEVGIILEKNIVEGAKNTKYPKCDDAACKRRLKSLQSKFTEITREKTVDSETQPRFKDAKMGENIYSKDASMGDKIKTNLASVDERLNSKDASTGERLGCKDASTGEKIELLRNGVGETSSSDQNYDVCPVTAEMQPGDIKQRHVIRPCGIDGPCACIGRPCAKYLQKQGLGDGKAEPSIRITPEIKSEAPCASVGTPCVTHTKYTQIQQDTVNASMKTPHDTSAQEIPEIAKTPGAAPCALVGAPCEIRTTTEQYAPGTMPCMIGVSCNISTQARNKNIEPDSEAQTSDNTSSQPKVRDMEYQNPLEMETNVEILNVPPPDLHLITTIVQEGNLEVVTEGPSGYIETTLNYLPDGALEVQTQINEENGASRRRKRSSTPKPISSHSRKEFTEERQKLLLNQQSSLMSGASGLTEIDTASELGLRSLSPFAIKESYMDNVICPKTGLPCNLAAETQVNYSRDTAIETETKSTSEKETTLDNIARNIGICTCISLAEKTTSGFSNVVPKVDAQMKTNNIPTKEMPVSSEDLSVSIPQQTSQLEISSKSTGDDDTKATAASSTMPIEMVPKSESTEEYHLDQETSSGPEAVTEQQTTTDYSTDHSGTDPHRPEKKEAQITVKPSTADKQESQHAAVCQTRDSECQSTSSPAEQSCQCCICKEIGVSTKEDLGDSSIPLTMNQDKFAVKSIEDKISSDIHSETPDAIKDVYDTLVAPDGSGQPPGSKKRPDADGKVLPKEYDGNAIGPIKAPDESIQSEGSKILPDGSILRPDGKMITPDGIIITTDGSIEKVAPDGSIQSEGSKVLPDGSILRPDETIIAPDGSLQPEAVKVLSDGGIINSDGTIARPDGTIVAPDGSIQPPGSKILPDENMKPDGSVVRPDGSIIKSNKSDLGSDNIPVMPDGKIVAKDGTVYTEGTVLHKDGAIERPDGSVLKPDGSIVRPDGSIVTPGSVMSDGSVITEDGSAIRPDGTIVKPDGTVIKPDGSILAPTTSIKGADESIIRPDGTLIKSDGTIVSSNGKTKAPKGSILQQDGSIVRPDGKIVHPDGTMSTILSEVDEETIKVVDIGINAIRSGASVPHPDGTIRPDAPVESYDSSDVKKSDSKKSSKEIKKFDEIISSEVPEFVSKLSSKIIAPTSESSDSSRPRKKRSSKFDLKPCTCADKCNCIICSSEIMEKRKQRGSSEANRKDNKPCTCKGSPKKPKPAINSLPSSQPNNLTGQKDSHPPHCTCKLCKCDPCVDPCKQQCEAFLKCINYDKLNRAKQKSRISIDDVFKPNSYIKDQNQSESRSPVLPRSRITHGLDCECVDCLCLPVIKDLISTRKIPNIREEKQIYQVSNVKCGCPKSKIPVSTNPAVPKVKSMGITCTCEPCACNPCSDEAKRDEGKSSDDAKLPTTEEVMKMSPEQLKELCDCDPCNCDVCFNKPGASAGEAICCCRPGCVCELCQVEDMKQQIESLRQEIESLKTPKTDDHADDCECPICNCPEGPNKDKLAAQQQGADGETEECDCETCDCPLSPLKAQKPSGHPPDCDCDICKCPNALGGEGGDVPAGCNCGSFCNCPGGTFFGKKKPMKGCTCEAPCLCPGGPYPSCDCAPVCDCSPCADPRKTPKSFPSCDCTPCDCTPCADPKLAPKEPNFHPPNCECPECKCADEVETAHADGCICDECKCEAEPIPQTNTCDCSICKCGEDTAAEHPEGCTCDICKCEEIAEEIPHPEGCTCETCKCAEEPPEGKPEVQEKCICPVCACDNTQPACVCDPCKCDEGLQTLGQKTCTCDVCTCDQGDAGKEKTDDAKMLERATHAADCSCPECKCADVSGGQGDKCVCTDCKCPECYYQNVTTAHAKDCRCPNCTCVDCNQKNEDGADHCKCSDCKCDPCAFQSEKKVQCKCGVCNCVECESGGKSAATATKTEEKKEEKKAVVAGPLPKNRSCHCVNCFCDDCSNVKKQGWKARPEIKIEAPPPGKKPAGVEGKKATADGELECTCLNCICVECITKNMSKKQTEDRTQKQGKNDCSCSQCQCSECSSKNTEMKHAPGCKCPKCTCTACNDVMAVPETKDAECHCATCKCEDCQKKGTHGANCKCPKCTCATCNAAEPVTKDAGCFCAICKCENCLLIGKGEPPPFEVPKKINCDCKNCTCVICSAKSSSGGKKNDCSGADKGVPPPFKIPERIQCLCQNCTCPICNKGGPSGAKSGAGCSCTNEKVCSCARHGNNCADVGGVNIENRPRGGGADVTPTSASFTPINESFVLPASEFAPLADQFMHSDCFPCICINCQCALFGGKKGGRLISTPGGDMFDIPMQMPCHCEHCRCSVCAKMLVANTVGQSAPTIAVTNPSIAPSSRPKSAPGGNIFDASDCTACTSPSENLSTVTKSALSSMCKCPECTEKKPSQISAMVGNSIGRINAKIGTAINLDEPLMKPFANLSNETASSCISCPDTSIKVEASSQLQSKSSTKELSCCVCPDCCLCANTDAVDLSTMDNITLAKQIETDTKENCACKEQIKEIKSALQNIKSACSDVEKKTIKKPLIKSASTFSQTMSGLKLALINLQEKCKAKDKMIEVMTGELKSRTSSQTLLNVLNICTGDPPDYDQTQDVKEKKPHHPVNEEKHTFDEKMAKAAETERGHRKKKSKPCKCGKIHKSKDGKNVDLSGFEVVDIRRITHDSIIIKWRPPKSNTITGYDIFINGVNKSKVMSGGRTSAMVHSIDLSATIQITIYAVTKCGRCEPPAIAIYEIRSQK